MTRTKSKKKIKNNNKKQGFTLIELLAVIAIIALLVGIAIYAVSNLMKKSEESANKVTYDSIKDSAVSYVNENYLSANYWLEEGENEETFCVPILELVNKGYLKKSEIENIESEFIEVVRDRNSKSILREDFADNSSCAGSGSSDSDGSGISRTVTLDRGDVTTSSVSLKANCTPNVGVSDYTFVSYFNGKKLQEVTQKNSQYTFHNLTRLEDGKYEFRAKCNYKGGISTDYSSPIEVNVGKTDIIFDVSDVELEEETSKLYKDVTIDFISEDVSSIGSYFRVTTDGVKSTEDVLVCGSDKVPGGCSENDDTTLDNDKWYKLNSSSNEVTLKVYSNSTVYAKVWDGEKYSTNKSIQVTFPRNPYVVVNIAHVGYEDISMGYSGENTEVFKYNVGNWLSNPIITWTVYGGFETKTYAYYSDEDLTVRSNDVDNYSTDNVLNSSNSSFTTTSSGGELKNIKVSGKQEIALVVVDVLTGERTIVKIWVDLDIVAPTMKVSVSSGTTYAKSKTATVTLNDTGESGLASNSVKIYYAWGTSSVDCSSMTKSITITPTSGASSATGSITIDSGTGAGKIYICNKDAAIYDVAGNSLAIGTSANANMYLDNTGPTVVASVVSSWTNTNKTITGTASDAHNGSISGYYISTSTTAPTASSSWQTSNQFTKGLGTYYIWAKDGLGNISSGYATVVVKNIETTSPTMKVSVSSGSTYATSRTATVTLSDSGGSGLANTSVKIYYAWGTSSIACSSMSSYITITPTSGASSATGTITIDTGTGAGKIYICNKDAAIYDVAGNSLAKASTASANMYLDNTGPSITFATNGNTTASQSHSTVVTATDSHNATVSTLKYLWTTTSGASASSGTSFTSGTTRTKSSGSGTYYLCVYAADGLGNSTNKCSSAFKFDNTAPTITFGTNGNSSYANSVSSKITVTNDSYGASLNTSSYVYTYSISSTATPGTAFTSGSSYSKSGVTGTYYLIAKACDSASNCTTKVSNKFYIDNTAPVVNISIKNSSGTVINAAADYQGTKTIKYNSGSWTNVVPTVHFSITDTSSITNYVYYNAASVYTGDPATASSLHNFNESDRSAKSGSIAINSGGIRQLKFVVTDAAGNVSTIYVNAWLDYTAPTCSYAAVSSGSSGATAKISCSDSGSGCSSGAGNKSGLTSSGYYYVYDDAGNSASCYVKVGSTYYCSTYKRCASAGCASTATATTKSVTYACSTACSGYYTYSSEIIYTGYSSYYCNQYSLLWNGVDCWYYKCYCKSCSYYNRSSSCGCESGYYSYYVY